MPMWIKREIKSNDTALSVFSVTGELVGILTGCFVSYLTNTFWLLGLLDLHVIMS